MDWKTEWRPLAWITTVFLACFWLPVGGDRFDGAIIEAFHLVKWYAREHVLLCLVPAFFIAGAIGVFVSQAAVMKYLGARANKVLAYGVASVCGTILAVCSCTVLPLFAGIYRMGAGLGPATAFLYSGPAINVLAIILTARVLGLELGVARAVGAILFSVVHRAADAPDLPARRAGQGQTRRWHCPIPRSRGPSGRTRSTSRPWSASWSSPTGAGPRPRPACGTPFGARSGSSPQSVRQALGIILASWFGLKLWKLAAIAVPALALALATPGHPELPFTVGVLALSVIISRDRASSETGSPRAGASPSRSSRCCFAGVLVAGALLGRPGHEGLIPVGLGGRGCRRQLSGGEPLRLGGWGVHVLRHADRGADPRGAPRQRHGPRAGAGAAAGRSRAQSCPTCWSSPA